VPLPIQRSDHRGIVILRPEGSLNEGTSIELQEAVGEVTEAGEADDAGGRMIVIDLSATSAASSHAFRMLLRLSKGLKSTGGRLVVCGASGGVQSALDLSGLARLCCVRRTTDEAIAELMVEERIVRLARIVSMLLRRAEERHAAALGAA
jgi:anti-anti-sigma factor